MSALSELLADPGAWQQQDSLVAALAEELGLDDDSATRIAETLAENEHARTTGLDQLWQLRERMSTAQSFATMGDFDFHLATNVNTCSDELFRIYGYDPGAIDPSYTLFFEHVHPEDRETVRAAYQRALATGAPYEMVERIRRADGELRYLWTNGEVIRDGDGKPVRMRGTSIDITDRVLAEQARAEAALRLGDAGLRRRQASEINDNLVQGLTAAIYALELDDIERVGGYLRQTLASASRMMTDLLEEQYDEHDDRALVRSAPASLGVGQDNVGPDKVGQDEVG